MKYECITIETEGQKTGPAKLYTYILDPVSVEPERKRPAVVVCPGGGYHFCSDREAEPIVTRFLAMGYHVFLLYYSVAPNRFPTALFELAKAVALVRTRSGEWTVDPDQIYVCGFSAGGHLTCSLGTFWNREFVYGTLGCDPETIRPNGLILSYPVITSGPFAHRGSFKNLLGENAAEGIAAMEEIDAVKIGAGQEDAERLVSLEYQVTPDMPRTFLWHTVEDASVPVENSLFLASAMRKQGVSFELHIYPKGVHGLSLANKETSRPDGALNIPAVQNWIDLVHTWIENA